MNNPDDIVYPTAEVLYNLAEQVLGRRPVVRDRHLLHKAAGRPALSAFGQAAYPTLFDKAAALLHAVAAHHLFYDGNKRTATAAVIWFLRANGLRPVWDPQQMAEFVLEIAQNRHDIPAIAAWLAAHTEALGES